MKKIFLTFCLFVAGLLATQAQTTTALVTYEGGYFVKDGDVWKEYRPAYKVGVWSSYKQFGEDDTFYYIENKKCYVAVPKLYKDKIFVDRDKGKKNWEVVYNTLSVHQRCPDADGLFYSYRNHRKEHSEYDGYYVRDNLTWREYRPRMKSGVWAEFKQSGEDENFFILKSSHNTVMIPKTTDDDILIYQNDNDNWRGGYAIEAIYDKSAAYDYNFYFDNSEKGGKASVPAKQCRISFDRKGNIQLVYDGKHHDLTYRNVYIGTYKVSDDILQTAIVISIDEKNSIWLFSPYRAMVNCKALGKKMFFIGGDNSKAFTEVNHLLESKSFEIL